MSTQSPAPPFDDPDIRPVVRTAASGNRSLWIFAGIVLVGAALLFEGLSARREQLSAPATQVAQPNGAMVTAPPPLALPPQFGDYRYVQPAPALPPPFVAVRPIAPPVTPQATTRVVERPAAAPSMPPPAPQPYVPQLSVPEPPAPPLAAPPAAAEKAAAPVNERVLAGRLRNPSFTVPQGTVIAAVLETALDSTRPGGVRAIIQRDVMGFDGTRVLIPRGSRLYGEYASDVGAGQKRALVRWTRLTRPDAVIVNLDSPSADPLGRAGVGGKLNSHFFERFGGAILQSILDVGTGLANSAAFNHGVYVALPGSVQAVPNLQPQEIKPTLKVKQGTSVSVFVAHDLDFSSVDQ